MWRRCWGWKCMGGENWKQSECGKIKKSKRRDETTVRWWSKLNQWNPVYWWLEKITCEEWWWWKWVLREKKFLGCVENDEGKMLYIVYNNTNKYIYKKYKYTRTMDKKPSDIEKKHANAGILAGY